MSHKTLPQSPGERAGEIPDEMKSSNSLVRCHFQDGLGHDIHTSKFKRSCLYDGANDLVASQWVSPSKARVCGESDLGEHVTIEQTAGKC